MIVYFNLPTVLLLLAVAFLLGVYFGSRWFGKKSKSFKARDTHNDSPF